MSYFDVRVHIAIYYGYLPSIRAIHCHTNFLTMPHDESTVVSQCVHYKNKVFLLNASKSFVDFTKLRNELKFGRNENGFHES